MAKQSALASLIPIALACAIIFAAYSFLQAPSAAAPQAGEISLSLQGGPMVDGNTAALRAVSACGDFSVSLDNAWFGDGAPTLFAPFLLEEGSHAFFAKGDGCNSTLSFTVAARECRGNGTSKCEINGCPGSRECAGGRFLECALPKRVCSPGERVGCSIDGCSFGYMACNQCGTSFGKCLPPSQKENASCDGNSSQRI
ncbi:MAG: hypothetical protein WC717_03615 [Candidatus Micrarchaeia archaeon]|jgi:hypothetical protein